MTWKLFFNCQGVTWPWHHSKKNFFFKTQKFWCHWQLILTNHWKTIWFWPTFNKERSVNYDVARRYMVPKFPKLEGKRRKVKVIRLYLAIHFYRFGFLLLTINYFFLRLWKNFFHQMIFLVLGFKKTVTY